METIFYLIVALVILLGAFTLIISMVKDKQRFFVGVILGLSWLTGVNFAIGPAQVRPEIASALIALVLGINLPKKVKRTNGMSIWLLLWVVFASVSSFSFALQPNASFWMLLQVCVGIIVFLYIVRADESEQYIRDFNRISIFISFLFVFGYFLFPNGIFGLLSFVSSDGSRLVGLSYESNILASQALVVLLLNLFRALTSKSSSKSAIILSLAVIILSTTRAVWIAAGLALIYYAFAKRNRLGIFFVVAPLTIIGLALSSFLDFRALALNESTYSAIWRLSNIFELDSGTAAYRFGIFNTAISDIFNTPNQFALGKGVNSFRQFHDIDATGTQSPYLSSYWLSIIYDTGAVGLVLTVGFFIALLFALKKRLHGLAVILCMQIAANSTNFVWFTYFWIFLAFLVVSERDFRDFGTVPSQEISDAKRTTSG